MTKNVFVTYSPFHVLTACGIAKGHGKRENVLIAVKDFPDADMYTDAIMEWKDSPFTAVFIINVGMQFAQRTAKQRLDFTMRKMDAMMEIHDMVLAQAPYNLYTFNDDTVESQFLLWRNALLRNYYVEDGLSSYYTRPGYRNVAYHVKALLRKMVFGRWCERPYPYGTSRKVSIVFSFYPELVVPELKAKRLDRIPMDVFKSIDGLVDILLRGKHVFPEKTTAPIAILLVPLAYQLAAKHVGMLTFIEIAIDQFKNDGVPRGNVHVKCHPRETTPLISAALPGVHVIDQHLSVEIMFSWLARAGVKVFLAGPESTAFITARLILGDNVDITCIARNVEASASMDDAFMKLGIKQDSRRMIY